MGRQNDLHHIRRPCIRITKGENDFHHIMRERDLPSHLGRDRTTCITSGDLAFASLERENDFHHIMEERDPPSHLGRDRTTCITSGDLAFASLERENDLHHIMGERPSTTSWQRQNDILGEGPPFTSWEKDSLRAPNSKSCLIMDRFAFQQFCQITIVGKYSPYMGTQITLLQIAASMCTVEYSLYLPITVQLTDI